MASFPFHRALVTGASSGIGAAMVEHLGAAGVSTVAVARRRDRLEALADRVPGVEVLVADLGTPDGCAAVVDRVTDEAHPVDLVVNNAGFGTGGAFGEIDVERLAAEIELNVVALTRIMHAAVTAMAPRGRGWVLNVASIAGYQPVPDLAVYSATKSYVLNLTEAVHAELAGTGVVVTALCPGLTRTEFQQISNTDGFEKTFPDAVWTTAEYVARVGLDAAAAGRAVAVPGVLYKGITAMSSVTPRWITRRVAGFAQRR